MDQMPSRWNIAPTTLIRLNPQVKEKVKKEIDRMLVVGLIFPVDELEWISSIVIQSKKGT